MVPEDFNRSRGRVYFHLSITGQDVSRGLGSIEFLFDSIAFRLASTEKLDDLALRAVFLDDLLEEDVFKMRFAESGGSGGMRLVEGGAIEKEICWLQLSNYLI